MSSAPEVERLIVTIRDQKVILDSDLAALYGVPTSRFNQAVKRNKRRFPSDFMFQLTAEEQESLTSQTVISKGGRGGRRTRPYVFTEHGALQAANILNSRRAVEMSLFVIRAFIKMREQLAANSAILKRLAEIDKTLLEHDSALGVIWTQLQPLLAPPPEPPKPRIGFHSRKV